MISEATLYNLHANRGEKVDWNKVYLPTIIHMRRDHGATYKQIADTTGLRYGKVKELWKEYEEQA